MVNYIDPKTGAPLEVVKEGLVNVETKELVAPIRNGLPRFVKAEEDYAESFGFQWNTWHSVLSNERSNYQHANDLKERSGLWGEDFDAHGKTLLECGMGGGDDTEVLLTLPLSEIHSFDISRAVDRGAKFLTDERLNLCQASIFEIPYPPQSFDIVWCHRVVQHTPDPERAMRCVCRMVKPGGFLFIHSYKKSKTYMREFRYKYRWLTTRVPKSWVFNYVRWFGPVLHALKGFMSRYPLTRGIAYSYIPYYLAPKNGFLDKMSKKEIIEWERMVTFDALTPMYDAPMSTEQFTSILKEEGFDIIWLHDPEVSPLLARAIRRN
jgi:ubiquinone/menaquinone biosynthesis C-methylase UbiE